MSDGKFLKTPNLPQSKITHAVIGDRYEKIEIGLLYYGIKPAKAHESRNLPKSISSHADMLFCDLGGGECITENVDGYLLWHLKRHGFKIHSVSEKLQPKYPYDVALNNIVTENFIIASEYADSRILKTAAERNIPLIKVKQGYVKCSVCLVNSNALITSDENIAFECQKNNIDVLKIRPGYIELPGYNYGFIGGCSGLLSPDTLSFTGDIRTHPDSENIISFCRNYGVNILSLTNKDYPLLDIGSVLPLLEA